MPLRHFTHNFSLYCTATLAHPLSTVIPSEYVCKFCVKPPLDKMALGSLRNSFSLKKRDCEHPVSISISYSIYSKLTRIQHWYTVVSSNSISTCVCFCVGSITLSHKMIPILTLKSIFFFFLTKQGIFPASCVFIAKR